jgi:mRNA interferase HigB
MDVVQRGKLVQFGKSHADARARLNTWHAIVCESQYADLNELRRGFPQVDYVRPFHVFNIGANYRLIAVIDFAKQRLIIRHILTHKEYDRGFWKKE